MIIDEIWKVFSKVDAEKIIDYRQHEVKLGQSIAYAESNKTEELKRLSHIGVKYAVVGIKECIGPLANCGKAGSQNAWDAFVPCFLNVQDNAIIDAKQFTLLGEIDVTEEQEIGMNLSAKDKHYHKSLRQIVADIDEKVVRFMAPIYAAGIVPILIGGGHNNAYPLIKSAQAHFKGKLAVTNCDPHADCRPLEGRHSGNPFSYAIDEGMLNCYHVFGLHENYNSQHTLEFIGSHAHVSTIFIEHIQDWAQELDQSFAIVAGQDTAVGVECDMDAIAYMPSSARSPMGIQLREARAFVRKMACCREVAYLHLPEAAPQDEVEKTMVGKALAYLVTDFLKTRQQIH